MPKRAGIAKVTIQGIPKCTLRTGRGRHREKEIPDNCNVLIDRTATLRVGDTLVPFIFMFDGTHLSNVPGDKKQWPEYMTIGNLASKIRQMTSTHSIVMVTLLPIPIKNRNIPQKLLDEQKQTNREVLNKVLWCGLQPLTIKLNPSAGSGYYNNLFADGTFRHCKPVLAGWLADCTE